MTQQMQLTKGNALITEPRRARRRLWAGLAVLLAIPAGLASMASAAGAAGSNTLTIKAGEYAYQLTGNPKPGNVLINFVNAGTESHMLVIARLKKSVTLAQVKAAAASSDPNAGNDLTEGPNQGNVDGGPALLGPGEHTSTITQLAAGHYALLCFFQAPDGKSHAAHGMIKVLDIKGSKSSYKAPKDGVKDVTLTDSGITVPTGPAPRHATLKVTNEGPAPHSFQLVKIAAGKTLDDAKSYFDTLFGGQASTGAPPAVLAGGISDLAPNGMSYLVLDLAPGHYGYVSTDGNAPDDDFSKGLKGEFDVK
jgi:hypothetical protein